MLLYTRTARPKPPKRRSRAGCNYCKEKKKKCDEARPACARCAEHGQACWYEPVRPRARRRAGDLAVGADESLLEDDGLAVSSEESLLNADDVEEVEVEVEEVEVVRRDGPTLASPASPGLGSPALGFRPPAFYEFSRDAGRRALMHHFCGTLSHLIVLREDRGNPFQQLVLPLAHGSPAVAGAVYALACAHLEVRGAAPGERSLHYHSEAVRGLARLIAQGAGADRGELLAAVMLLVYYEVLVQQGRSSLVDGHLRGAMAIMAGGGAAETSPTTVFLERAFRFHDVIAALSLGTAPLSGCPGGGLAPLDSRGAASDHGVDALLGMATSLWPVIDRLSRLPGLRRALEDAVARGDPDAAALRTGFVSACAGVEAALHAWAPVLPRGAAAGDARGGAETASLRSVVSSALAYRHSALVHLHRSVYGRARGHAAVQHHARASLAHCEATVAHGGPMGSLLWPLFVAACEAAAPADRARAARAFAGVERRQGMRNIERAWRVVREVWRRADAEPGPEPETGPGWRADLWRSVSRDLGVTVVLG